VSSAYLQKTFPRVNGVRSPALTTYDTGPLASDRLSKLFLCLNDILDGDLCKNSFYFHIFSFWFSNMTLSDVLILPVSQLQNSESQITSHIEYYIRVFILSSKLMKNRAIMTGFNTI